MAVSSADATLGQEIARLYAACRSEGTPSRSIDVLTRAIHPAGPPVLDLYVDGEWCTSATDVDDAVLHTAWHLDQIALTARARDTMVLHAALAAQDDGAVVLTGSSGAGKSTLVGALTTAGFAYGADEQVGLDPSGRLLANPRPCKLDHASLRALGASSPDAGGPRSSSSAGRPEVLVAPGELGSVLASGTQLVPRLVVQPEYRAGARCRRRRLSPAQVALLLAEQTFEFAQWGGVGLDRLASVARGCPGYHVTFGSVVDARDAIEQVLRSDGRLTA